MPYFIADMITSHSEQSKGDVNIPLGIGGVFLGQNRDFESHLLSYREVCCLEVFEQLIHDGLCIGGVAHAVEQI